MDLPHENNLYLLLKNHGSHFPRKTFDRLFDMTQKKIFCQMIIIGCGGDGVAARHNHIRKISRISLL